MQISLECIRDILLCVEKHTSCHMRCYFYEDESCQELREHQALLLVNYSIDELFYHIRYCIKVDLISEFKDTTKDGVLNIVDLTPKGHDFIANIRDEANWKRTLDVCKKVGATGLNNAIEFSRELISSLGKTLLGPP